MASKTGRVKSGIPGFDKIIQGGLLDQSITLVTGAPGTGKTIFSLSFIYNGAYESREKGLYVTFEQPTEDLVEQGLQFGWDISKVQDKIHILSLPIEKIHKETLDLIKTLVNKFKAKRLVIDSLSTLCIAAPQFSNVTSEYSQRFFIYKFISELRKLKCTTLLISELRHEDWLGQDTSAEFVADNVILLKYFGAKGTSSRTLAVKKARRTKFDENIYPIRFSAEGIVVEDIKKIAMPDL